jgi:hypothetical protein
MSKLESIARVTRATKQNKGNNPQSINILEGLAERINSSSTQYEVEDVINEYNYELALNYKNTTNSIINEFNDSLLELKEKRLKTEKELQSKRIQFIDEKNLHHSKSEFDKEDIVNNKMRKNNLDIQIMIDKFEIQRTKLINDKERKLRELEIKQTEYKKEFNTLKTRKLSEIREQRAIQELNQTNK